MYPAERMNTITANALLKTLEEPPGHVKFALASEAAHQLLPTIRSRCLGHNMVWPSDAACMTWLQQQGVSLAHAQVWLRAAGGRPSDALHLARSGRDPRSWAQLPKAMAQGDVSAVQSWSPPELVDALQKLCHDLMATAAQTPPRFFQTADLPKSATLSALAPWSKALMGEARTAEHPFNPGLMLESLVSQAQNALNSGR